MHARGLPWEVVHAEPAGEQRRYRLRCLHGALRGCELDLLHPLEPLTPITREMEPRRAGRLKEWLLYHQAFLLDQALGPSALLAVQPGRIEIAPYQLVPVIRALRMSRPRLLLADGVGLGKTIEAGLVMAELIARRRAHRILVVSPAALTAVANTFVFDWVLRLKASANVNLFILRGCPFPTLGPARERFLAHGALRLTCNHAGYAGLWAEQLGDTWREPSPPRTWPVLAGDDARWALRAALDAVVADAYGLDRDHYEHVLSSFRHTSYPAAPERCLDAFDTLHSVGLPAFLEAHDPYHDVPLVEALPVPALDLASLLHESAEPADGASPPKMDLGGQFQLLPTDDGPLFAAAARRDSGGRDD